MSSIPQSYLSPQGGIHFQGQLYKGNTYFNHLSFWFLKKGRSKSLSVLLMSLYLIVAQKAYGTLYPNIMAQRRVDGNLSS